MFKSLRVEGFIMVRIDKDRDFQLNGHNVALWWHGHDHKWDVSVDSTRTEATLTEGQGKALLALLDLVDTKKSHALDIASGTVQQGAS